MTKKTEAEKAHDAYVAANLEAMRVMDESKPTPTQEENDRAKLGIVTDDKEPDGSPEEKSVAARASVADASAPYKNRASRTE